MSILDDVVKLQDMNRNLMNMAVIVGDTREKRKKEKKIEELVSNFTKTIQDHPDINNPVDLYPLVQGNLSSLAGMGEEGQKTAKSLWEIASAPTGLKLTNAQTTEAETGSARNQSITAGENAKQEFAKKELPASTQKILKDVGVEAKTFGEFTAQANLAESLLGGKEKKELEDLRYSHSLKELNTQFKYNYSIAEKKLEGDNKALETAMYKEGYAPIALYLGRELGQHAQFLKEDSWKKLASGNFEGYVDDIIEGMKKTKRGDPESKRDEVRKMVGAAIQKFNEDQDIQAAWKEFTDIYKAESGNPSIMKEERTTFEDVLKARRSGRTIGDNTSKTGTPKLDELNLDKDAMRNQSKVSTVLTDTLSTGNDLQNAMKAARMMGVSPQVYNDMFNSWKRERMSNSALQIYPESSAGFFKYLVESKKL